MPFKEIRFFIITTLVIAVLVLSQALFFLSSNMASFISSQIQAMLAGVDGTKITGENRLAMYSDVRIRSAPFAYPTSQVYNEAAVQEIVEPITDARDNPNETHMFRYDYTGGSIEIGRKSSGLPGYRIADDTGRFVEIEVDPASLYDMSDKKALVRSRENLVWFLYDNFTIRFKIEPERIKTDYILKSIPQKGTIGFKIKNSPDFYWVKNVPHHDAVYTLVKGNGDPPFVRIKSPVARDSDGSRTQKIDIILRGGSGKILIDSDFLARAKYPIYIDPTVYSGGNSTSALFYVNGRKLFKDSKGNFLVFSLNAATNDELRVSYSNNGGQSWTVTSAAATNNPSDRGSNAILDINNRLHMSWSGSTSDVSYNLASPSYNGDSTIDSIAFGNELILGDGGTNNIHREPSLILLHDGFPAIAWVRETGGGVNDSSVLFERCASGISGGTLGCDDATSKWINAARTASNSPDQIFTTGANSLLFVTLAQVPSSAGTQASALAVFFSRANSTALRRSVATCNNCSATPPTWNAWDSSVIIDSSTVSSTRGNTDLSSVADSANKRIVYTWASASSSCSAGSGFCLLSQYRDFSTASASNSTLKEISANATESSVDRVPNLNYISAASKYYLVAASFDPVRVLWRSIPDTWTSWSGANLIESIVFSGNVAHHSPFFMVGERGTVYLADPSAGIVKFNKIPTYNQAGYRFFSNNNSAQIGATLAGQNAAATAPAQGTAFRLRLLVHNDNLAVSAGLSSASFKLQFAGKGGGTCASPSGTPSTYTDISTTTSISFADNAAVADGIAHTASPSVDPTHGSPEHASNSQTYEEANNFINSQAAIASNSDSIWDFALKDLDADASTVFCFRAAESDNGAPLDVYDQRPEITTAAAAGETLTFTIDAGSAINFGTVGVSERIAAAPCTNKCTTRLKIDTNSADGWSVTAGKDRVGVGALFSVDGTIINDTSTGIGQLTDGVPTPCNTETWPASVDVSSGLGFTVWSSDAKDTGCWGSGTTSNDSLNTYAAFPDSVSAAKIVRDTDSTPNPSYHSVGYSLEVLNTQKATTYDGDIIYTATASP